MIKMENCAIGIHASILMNLEIFWKQNSNNPKNNSQGGNPTNKNTHGAVSNPLDTKQKKSADDFLEMYKNLIGLPYNFRNSNLTEIKSYCRSTDEMLPLKLIASRRWLITKRD